MEVGQEVGQVVGMVVVWVWVALVLNRVLLLVLVLAVLDLAVLDAAHRDRGIWLFWWLVPGRPWRDIGPMEGTVSLCSAVGYLMLLLATLSQYCFCLQK